MENFWTKKFCVKMVPKSHTDDLLERKTEIYANILQRIEGNDERLNRFVTRDEN
jgi:hypothetical protein